MVDFAGTVPAGIRIREGHRLVQALRQRKAYDQQNPFIELLYDREEQLLPKINSKTTVGLAQEMLEAGTNGQKAVMAANVY